MLFQSPQGDGLRLLGNAHHQQKHNISWLLDYPGEIFFNICHKQ